MEVKIEKLKKRMIKSIQEMNDEEFINWITGIESFLDFANRALSISEEDVKAKKIRAKWKKKKE